MPRSCRPTKMHENFAALASASSASIFRYSGRWLGSQDAARGGGKPIEIEGPLLPATAGAASLPRSHMEEKVQNAFRTVVVGF